MATTFGDQALDKEVIAWAKKNGYTFDEKTKVFKQGDTTVDRDAVFDAMTQALIKAQNMAIMGGGYSISDTGAILREGKPADLATDKEAKRIADQIAERQALMAGTKFEEIAKERGWISGTAGKVFTKDGVTISKEKLTLMLAKEGAFKTDQEKFAERRESILTELDVIKDAAFKKNKNVENQMTAMDKKLKAQRRQRLLYLGGAILGVGITAASAGLLAPVAGVIMSGAAIAGPALTSLTLSEIGLCAGLGLAGGLGVGYGLTAYQHFSDPHHAAAKISLKLSKHMQRVYKFEQEYALNPTPENKIRLERALKQENEYAAKQVAKMEKKRAKLEKKADKKLEKADTLHGRLLGYNGYADKKLQDAKVFGEIKNLMEQDIQNSFQLAGTHKLDIAATRGKTAKIIQEAYSRTGKVTNIEIQASDLENNDMVAHMINDHIAVNQQQIVDIISKATDLNSAKDAVVQELVDKKIVADFDESVFKDVDHLGNVASMAATMSVLVAMKQAKNLDLNNSVVRSLMQDCIKGVAEYINDENLRDQFLGTLTTAQRDLINQIYGPTIVKPGQVAVPGKEIKGAMIDNVDRVREMQSMAGAIPSFELGTITPEQQSNLDAFKASKDLVTQYNKDHGLIGKAKGVVKKVANTLHRSSDGLTPTEA